MVRWVVLIALVLVVHGCGGRGEAVAVAGESVLSVDIPGTTGGATSTGDDGTITRLYDVSGDWNEVSVAIARIVQQEGWTITALNCVGSGNDVIAFKQTVDGRLLLESGAGERGAGIIIRPDPTGEASGPVRVTGSCPRTLVDAVR